MILMIFTSLRRSLLFLNLNLVLDFHRLILWLFATLIYFNSLKNEFAFDDKFVIEDNLDVRWRETDLIKIFTNDYWGMPIKHITSHKSYRPLTILSFGINYYFGQLNPLGYHLVNIILHSFNCILFYNLCKNLFYNFYNSKRISFVASLLFASHPIHTEAVCNVVGRAELLCSFFFFLSLNSYLLNHNIKFVIFTLLSILCKEQGATVVGVAFVFEFILIFRRKQFNGYLKKNEIHLEKNKQLSKGQHRKMFNLFILALSILIFRLWINGTDQLFPVFSIYDNPPSKEPFLFRVLTYNYIYYLNFLSLFFPNYLCSDWSMNSIPLVKNLFDTRILKILLFYLILFSTFLIGLKDLYPLYNKTKIKYSNNILLSFFLMILPFLPASNIFVPVGFVLAERVLYLPSVGFCMLIAIGFESIYLSFKQKRTWLVINLCFVLLIFSLKCYLRNEQWSSNFTLFSGDLNVNPNNAKLYNNLGLYFEKNKSYDQAYHHYLKALELNPDFPTTKINIGRLMIATEKFDLAEKLLLNLKDEILFNKKLNQIINRNYLDVWHLLGNLYANQGKYKIALDLYNQILEMKSDYYEANLKIIEIYVKLKEYNKAIDIYDYLIRKHYSHADVYYNFGITLVLKAEQSKSHIQNEDYINIIENAFLSFINAIQKEEKHYGALLNAALLLQKYPKLTNKYRNFIINCMKKYQGKMQENVYANLALLLQEDHHFYEAEYFFKLAIATNENYRFAQFNLVILYLVNQDIIQAKREIIKLIAKFPNDVSGLLLAAKINLQTLNYSKSIKYLQKILDLSKTYSQSNEIITPKILEEVHFLMLKAYNAKKDKLNVKKKF